MNVSAWCIRNPIPALLLFVLLSVLGVLSFRAMKIQNFPDIDLPTVVVAAALPGASPTQLETEVARKLEDALATLQNVKHLYTKVQDGAVTITVEFRLEKNSQEALDDVRSAVARVRADLPAELRDPVVAKLNLSGTPVMTYTIASSRKDPEALSWFVDHTLTAGLLGLKGVGAVSRVGGVSREVRVELDPTRLLALNASVSDISRQLRQVQQDAAGGQINVAGADQPVRTIASVASAADLAQLELALSDRRRIRLGQVAQVLDTVAEPRSAALLNGQPVVAFEVVRALGAGEVDLARQVRAHLEAVRAAHPDLTINEAFNVADPVEESYNGSMALLYEGALLAVLVVWAFLRDWRATLVVATALPLSVLPTFVVMHHGFGLTLNVVTLLSLSLVVGILVDDAIVEIENIMRHLAMGKTPYQAAMEAADEIGLAVIATTFTLVAVFLPTAFLAGVPGKFFVHFGWTAAIAVFFSLVVARMLTPMMAAYLLRKPRRDVHEPGWLKPYGRLAAACLRQRWLTMALALVFAVGSLALVPLLPTGFMPPDDFSQTQVRVTLPPGSGLAQVSQAAEAARQIVQRHPQVRRVYTAVGGGATGSDPFAAGGVAEVRTATLTVGLSPREARQGISKQAIETELRQALAALPGVRLQVGFAAGEKLILLLSGDDGEALTRHARLVERELRGIPGIGNVLSGASLARPELVVRPDATRAADMGVTAAAIADTLRVATAGDHVQALAKLNLSQRQVPVLVRLPAQARDDLDLLARLPVAGSRGPVPLGQVATLAMDSGPTQIDRYDRRRQITIEVELNHQALGDVQRAAFALPSLRQPPPGISAVPVGDVEAMAELFDSFGVAIMTGVLCIYLVLVLLFKDFVQPVTILGALALSVPGACLALFVTHTAVSMPALIGLIMLMGIAAKNSILLVDYIIIAREQHGLGRWNAVLDACHKRARPIIMTTIAMGAGMLPIALGLGVDPSFRAPMALVAIGGLITSTVLSLLVIPVLYTLVDDAIRLVVRKPRLPRPVAEGAVARSADPA